MRSEDLGVIMESDAAYIPPIFHANYATGSIDAVRSIGSPTALYEVSRDATHPATFINADGKIEMIASADTPRFTHGYWADNGVLNMYPKSGLKMETASTNYIYDSAMQESPSTGGWNTQFGAAAFQENTTLFESSDDIKEAHLTHTFTGDETSYRSMLYSLTANGSISEGDAVTISFIAKVSSSNVNASLRMRSQFLKSDFGYAGVIFEEGIAGYSSEYKKYVFTATAPADTSKIGINFGIMVASQSVGATVDISVACVQIEKSPIATSFIPTGASAYTRNAESLRYLCSGNRATVESCIMEMSFDHPMSAGTSNYTYSDGNHTTFYRSGGTYQIAPVTGEDCKASSYLNTSAKEIEYVSYSFQHVSPYASIYRNGELLGTDTDNDYGTPTFGTRFYAFWNTNGVIFNISIYNRALTIEEHRRLSV